MKTTRGGLLAPSLSPALCRPAAAPFSPTSGFVASFFGGPFAALAAFGLNVHRLQRWRQDGSWLLAGLLVTLGWYLWLPNSSLHDAWRSAATAALGTSAWTYLDRALALALFLAGHGRHRVFHRAAGLSTLPRPNGWLAGFAAYAFGKLMVFLLHALPS